MEGVGSDPLPLEISKILNLRCKNTKNRPTTRFLWQTKCLMIITIVSESYNCNYHHVNVFESIMN